MRRPQDLGGMKGFGRVPVENDDGPPEPWQDAVIAGNIAAIAAGLFSIDEFRAGIDEMHPIAYLGTSYYERWLHTLEHNLVKKGVIGEDELERRVRAIAEDPHAPLPARADPALTEVFEQLLPAGAPSRRESTDPPRFQAGDGVRGRTFPDRTHARIPGYAQGKVGLVHAVHDAYLLPDANLEGEETPQYVYTVGFDARALWPDAGERSTVLVDLWESYLEPA